MKSHVGIAATGLLMGCLAAAVGQAATVPAKEQDKANENLQTFTKAFNTKDVPAIMALYADDAVAVTPGGIFEGPALQTWIEAQLAAGGHDLSLTVKKTEAHGNEVWRYGEWAASYGQQPQHGYWADIAVGVGDTWKLKRSVTNIALEAMPKPVPGETASR